MAAIHRAGVAASGRRQEVPRCRTMALYDAIGRGHAERRKPHVRFAARIVCAVGNAQTIVNVVAGAGSYEPGNRDLVAVEPSMVMIRQRSADAATVVCASAMSLPFRDENFDASPWLGHDGSCALSANTTAADYNKQSTGQDTGWRPARHP